ncbi:MAG: Gfo/Idh/MocA family oxidoreductase [Lentisphaerae bacterium]|jgi:predicted dehydrogenase|nr:Gfo/Idh/MocA family oxidoreductase [Lentisphaerota bacterium]
MNDNKVKIAFAGVGNMGQAAHLKNYASLPDCEVVALSELREDLRNKVATKYGVPKTYASIEEMVAAGGFDAIVAAQPFSRHGTLMPELLKAKVPVLTEKPLAASIEAGEGILKALAESGTWHMVGYNKRSDPATMYVKEEINRLKETEELGPMTYIRISMPAGDWISGGFFDMISSSEPYGSGVLEWDPPASDMDEETFKKYEAFVNYYIHQINLMRHLLGEPYQITYADKSGVFLSGQSESNIACTLEMSPYTTNLDWQECAFVCFQKGWIKLELPAPLAINRAGRVTIFSDPGEGAVPQTIMPQMPPVHSMRQQAINFIRAVKGEIKPLCEAAEALEDLKLSRDYIRLLTGK